AFDEVVPGGRELAGLGVAGDVVVERREIVGAIVQNGVFRFTRLQRANAAAVRLRPDEIHNVAQLAHWIPFEVDPGPVGDRGAITIVRRKDEKSLRRQYAPNLGENLQAIIVRYGVKEIEDSQHRIERTPLQRAQVAHVSLLETHAGELGPAIFNHV